MVFSASFTPRGRNVRGVRCPIACGTKTTRVQAWLGWGRGLVFFDSNVTRMPAMTLSKLRPLIRQIESRHEHRHYRRRSLSMHTQANVPTSRLRVYCFGVSLEGFGAGPYQSREEMLAKGDSPQKEKTNHEQEYNLPVVQS